MAYANPIKVLVLHHDPVAREGLLTAFARYPDLEVVNEQDNPMDAGSPKPLTSRFWADVIVADYESGVRLAARAARRTGAPDALKILILATSDREWEIRNALERGVRGYLLVGCALDDLACGVRAVYRGARHLSPQVAQRLAESISAETLTSREEEVLRLVVEGLGNKTIARRLDIAVGTVKSHLKGVFDKLNVDSRTQAICAAERRGLLRDTAFPDDIEESLVQDAGVPGHLTPVQYRPHAELEQ